MKYQYIIKFHLPLCVFFTEQSGQLSLGVDGCILEPLQEETINKDNKFIIISEKMDNSDQLTTSAENVELALRLSSLDFGFGIISKVSNPTERSIITEHGLSLYSKPELGIYAKNLKDGINCFELSDEVKHITFPLINLSSMQHGKPADTLIKKLKEYYLKNISITPTQDVAIDMLNSAFHEGTPWARFLLCISAIEILIPANKKLSISRRCREYIKDTLGSEQAEIFKKLYKIRCDIAHGTFHKNEGHPDFDPAFSLAKSLLYKQLKII